MHENERLLDEKTTVLDFCDHPFRALCGYEEWANQAGVMASNLLDKLYIPLEAGVITEEDVKSFETNAYPVIRRFNEYGYNSRALDTVVLDRSGLWSFLTNFVGHEETEKLKEKPAIVRGALLKLAKDSFIWGRTGEPEVITRLGEEIPAATIPNTARAFFPEDIESFATQVSKEVTETTLDTLRREGGLLGRVALRMQHRTVVLPRRDQKLTREQFLRLAVQIKASSAVSLLLTNPKVDA